MARYDIVALGESLVDFVVQKNKNRNKLGMEGTAGGAPTNVLAAAAKLGRSTAIIGRVGRDAFGDFLEQSMRGAGINVEGLVRGDEPTTLSIVSLDKKGERSFSFYWKNTADEKLKESDVDLALVNNCRIFHFGTVSMSNESTRAATMLAALRAQEKGARISFDPNYREFIWDSEHDALESMEQGIAIADYVKLSEMEAVMMSGEKDPEKAALNLLTKHNLQFIAVTLGADGCVVITPKARLRLPTYDVDTVDTTGAGDAFWGAALHKLMAYRGSGPMDGKALEALLHYANAAGALATSRPGALHSFASDEEITKLVKKGRLLADD